MLISLNSLIFINTYKSHKNLIRNLYPRDSFYDFNLNLQKEPYLLVDVCTMFMELSPFDQHAEKIMETLSAFRGQRALEEYKNRQENSFKLLIQRPIKLSTFYSNKINKLGKYHIDKLEIDDITKNCEESLDDGHTATISNGLDIELYKVTEYNESLEYSATQKSVETGNRIDDLSTKVAGSLIEKFPKFSVTSLSLSDTSYQNAYEQYKKSYLEQTEQLDGNSYSSPEKTFAESQQHRKSPFEVTTNLITLSDSNAFKMIVDTKADYCECSRCEIY